MAYELLIQPAAAKSLRQLPRELQRRVHGKILSIAADPRGPGRTKLSGHTNLYRVRAGDYRIVYSIDDAKLTVTIIIIAHRREVYRDL